jgi:Ran-binding protein 3
MAPPTSQRRESPQPSETPTPSNLPSDDPSNNSDGESGEKPVREKLRDTTIAGQSSKEEAPSASESQTREANEPATTTHTSGRLRRKRSIEDVEGADKDAGAVERPRHVRKLSNDTAPASESTSEEAMGDAPATANGSNVQRVATPDLPADPMDEEEQKAGLKSPNGKRTRDQVLQDEEVSTNSRTTSVGVTGVSQEEKDVGSKKMDSEEERKIKGSRDSGSPQPSSVNEGSERSTSDTQVTKVYNSHSMCDDGRANPECIDPSF